MDGPCHRHPLLRVVQRSEADASSAHIGSSFWMCGGPKEPCSPSERLDRTSTDPPAAICDRLELAQAGRAIAIAASKRWCSFSPGTESGPGLGCTSAYFRPPSWRRRRRRLARGTFQPAMVRRRRAVPRQGGNCLDRRSGRSHRPRSIPVDSEHLPFVSFCHFSAVCSAVSRTVVVNRPTRGLVTPSRSRRDNRMSGAAK